MQTQTNQNRCRLGLSSVLLISPSIGNTRSITEFGNSYDTHMFGINQSTTVPGSTELRLNPALNIKFERLT
ncbi:hypothetical protein GQ457_05G032630 [Hibiscus cannabinus]